MRLIDADKYRKKLKKAIDVECIDENTLLTTINILDCELTIDATPIVHGHWEDTDWIEPDYQILDCIRTKNAAFMCSNCHRCFKKELLWVDNFCPNCGTKMDEEEK